jgi:hypothetical protein
MLSDDVKQLLTEVAELARRLARLPVEAQAHLDSITVSVLALFDRCRGDTTRDRHDRDRGDCQSNATKARMHGSPSSCSCMAPATP